MKRTVIRRALEAGLVSLGVFIIVVCSAIPARAQTPSISSISPNSTVAGGGNFTLTVTGSGFNGPMQGGQDSQVRWNGDGLSTTFNSVTSLTAMVPAANIATAGTASVTVFNQGGGGGTSNPVTFSINNPAPVISGLSPNSAVAGGGNFTLTVSGSGFVSGSIIRWQGSNRTTMFGSGTSLTATIPASDIASAGNATVTVFNPAPGGGTSNGAMFTITAPNPTPSISSLNPSSATAGGAAFTLTVSGSNFVSGSVVRWNGSNRSTTFGSVTQLTASIPASDIASAGTIPITVSNPAPGGGISNSVSFTIVAPNPAPSIGSIDPTSVVAGSGAFTLTVTGSGFIGSSVVQWNGTGQATTFANGNQLTASILASDVASAGSASVTVVNPSPGGGTSNSVSFTIVAPNPVPSMGGISPTSMIAGSAGFTLTVTGSGFIASSVVRWNGTNKTTTFGSATSLSAAILASDIASAGSADVTVFNPSPGGGTSAAASFSITNPVPVLSGISPTSAIAGSAAFTLTVTGSNFINGSVVRWNGSDRPTSAGGSQLTAMIPASDIASGGTAAVTVFNPGPGGGTSNGISFSINNPAPVLTSINPTSALAGGPAFTLTVAGSNFVSGSVVRWNGSDRATSGSGNQLTAAIPASDIAAGGTASITVFNPGPGGGASDAAPFTINNPVPVLASINPTSALTGGPAFTLAVSGSNFVSGAVVRWNGADRPTSGGGNQLTATIPATDLATGGTATITVVNPGPGGGASNAASFAINNPVPVIASTNPTSALTGGAAFTLAVSGSNFVTGSVVRWNGADRPTSGDASQLSAAIPASDIAAGGAASIAVFNPAPGGGLSNAVSFTVTNSLPVISSLNPSSVIVGGPAFTLTLNGSNFASGAVVRWNEADRPTTFASSTQLTAAIPASDISAVGTANVTVSNPAPGGGVSTPATLSINNPTPSITTIAPSSAVAGGPPFTLVVNGTNFVGGSIVRWNGSNRATVFVSNTQISASILDSDLATGGSSSITVLNPAPGGGVSNAINFAVSNAVPTISALSPGSATAGSGAFSLTITGTGFTPASVVRWNGVERPTTSSSPTLLTASIPASDITAPGTAVVTVTNPAPLGGTSNSVTFTITSANPLPVITRISPDLIGAGNPAFTLTVTGTGFVSNSVVRWNGTDRTTSFISDTQLTASIPAVDVAALGTASVTVVSPAPGGGTSNAVTFSIVSGNPTPDITRLEPPSTPAGGPGFSLAVIGSGFTTTSAVRWNGSNRTTTYISVTELRAAIPATDIETAGSVAVTVFNPAPNGGTSNTQNFTVLGAGLTINGVSDTVDSMQQPSINLTIPAPRPGTVSGRVTLTFTSSNDDPAIQFELGSRTVNFTIPANATQAVFPSNATAISFQTGTIAGTIMLEAVADGMSGSSRTITVNRRAPRITSLSIGSRTTSSFQLVIVGFSNNRTLTQGTFRFVGRPGTNLQTSSVTVDLGSAFTAWYQSAASGQYGSQFRLVLPFNVQGDINAIGSVSVTLTNSEGNSEQSTVNF